MREAVVLIVPDVGARAGEGEASASRLVVLAVHEEALELLVDDEHGLAAHCEVGPKTCFADLFPLVLYSPKLANPGLCSYPGGRHPL